jgi:hypothetical protein
MYLPWDRRSQEEPIRVLSGEELESMLERTRAISVRLERERQLDLQWQSCGAAIGTAIGTMLGFCVYVGLIAFVLLR